jgi:hypothetical protein
LAKIEREGVPAVGIICQGFTESGRVVAEKEGVPGARILEFPQPNILIQTREQIYESTRMILNEVVEALTKTEREAITAKPKAKADPRQVEFRGSLEEINEFFRKRKRTDGLPIMPPTLEAVERMLQYTDRSPEEVIGVLPPANYAASVWKVAVNGVMAGCRPEYMPVLLAVTEAVAEPRFNLQLAPSSSGWAPFMIINGPIIKDLDFNHGAGVLRPSRQANITVARFLRLLMINVAGMIVGESEIATFGRNYEAALAEAEADSPWEPLHVERGFNPGSSVVTVQSSTGMGDHFITSGDALNQLKQLCREITGALTLTPLAIYRFGPEISPLICLSPLTASSIAKGGYSKRDVKQYFYENARIPAHHFEEKIKQYDVDFSLSRVVQAGILPKIFAESEDPNRLVPLVRRPEDFLITVSGFPNRSRCFIMEQNGKQGMTVSKEIKLPGNWDKLRKR